MAHVARRPSRQKYTPCEAIIILQPKGVFSSTNESNTVESRREESGERMDGVFGTAARIFMYHPVDLFPLKLDKTQKPRSSVHTHTHLTTKHNTTLQHDTNISTTTTSWRQQQQG
jgi:hypothetical protein